MGRNHFVDEPAGQLRKPIMARPISLAQAEQTRGLLTLFNGTGVYISTYIGGDIARRKLEKATEADVRRDGELHPMAYLVEQEPKSEIHAHFHRSDQFQLFVGGDGTIGKRPINGFALHYAGAFTTYGPINSGQNGVNYLTLRNGWDPGASWMPQSRDVLKEAGSRERRHHMVDVAQIMQEMPQDTACTLINPATDGVGAWLHRLGDGAIVSGPDPALGRGQYWIVLDGDAHIDSHAADLLSCTYIDCSEPSAQATAGTRGATIVIVQFPLHEPARMLPRGNS
jgi:hypothetical protein